MLQLIMIDRTHKLDVKLSSSSSTIVINAEESSSVLLCSNDLNQDCVKSVQHGVSEDMGVVQIDRHE